MLRQPIWAAAAEKRRDPVFKPQGNSIIPKRKFVMTFQKKRARRGAKAVNKKRRGRVYAGRGKRCGRLGSVSAVLSSGRKSGAIIYGLDNLDESTKIAHFNTRKNKYLEYETVGGRTLLVTKNAKTISIAVNNLYEELDTITFEGKKYRKDLCLVNSY